MMENKIDPGNMFFQRSPLNIAPVSRMQFCFLFSVLCIRPLGLDPDVTLNFIDPVNIQKLNI